MVIGAEGIDVAFALVCIAFQNIFLPYVKFTLFWLNSTQTWDCTEFNTDPINKLLLARTTRGPFMDPSSTLLVPYGAIIEG